MLFAYVLTKNFLNQSKHRYRDVDKFVAEVVSVAYNDLPMMIDSVTRIDTVIAMPGKTVLYCYTLLWCSKDNINNDLDSIDLANILYSYSRNITMLSVHTILRNRGITFEYLYRDKDGNELTRLRLTKKNYTELTDPMFETTIGERLATEAKIMNKNLPMMVDSVTRLDTVIVIQDKTILHSYTLLYRKKELFSNKLDSAEFAINFYKELRNDLKSSMSKAGMSVYRDSGVVFEYRYKDKNGKKLTTFRFEKKDYADGEPPPQPSKR